MKAQSAVEYLTTYGWMFVSLAIVAGAIYSFTGGSCVESTSGFTASNLDVEDFGLQSSSANMSVLLQNRAEDSITIEQIRVSDSEGVRTLNYTENIAAGQEKQANLPGFEQTESCNSMEVTLIYELGPLENQYVSGDLTSNLGVSDKEAPEAFDSVSAELN